jgi:hypothetical protein
LGCCARWKRRFLDIAKLVAPDIGNGGDGGDVTGRTGNGGDGGAGGDGRAGKGGNRGADGSGTGGNGGDVISRIMVTSPPQEMSRLELSSIRSGQWYGR